LLVLGGGLCFVLVGVVLDLSFFDLVYEDGVVVDVVFLCFRCCFRNSGFCRIGFLVVSDWLDND